MVNSRNKGHSYERKVAKEYKEIFGLDYIGTARYYSRAKDDQGIDIVNVPNLNIQCKNYKNYSVGQAIKDLKAMPVDTNINIEHCKITGKGECVVLLAKDRLNLCKNISKSLSSLDD